jgi:glycerate kinase
MKVVIAIDSFKGSLSSLEAGMAIREGILKACEAEIIIKPLADGGEGTVNALLFGMDKGKITLDATGPLGNKITCSYGILEDGKTAIIEIAQAAGIKLVPKQRLNPLYTTTYGVGEMINDAIERGCRNFIIGIGGSATNDAGVGMLMALGYEFYNIDGNPVKPIGNDLSQIASIVTDNALNKLSECSFRIACDVNSPFYGPKGAAYVFAPQKGASAQIVEILDTGLRSFSELVKKVSSKDIANLPGTGAAGGLGYAFLAFLNAKLESGIDIILEEICLENDIKDCDFVITGEGKLDYQTTMGKAPIGVAKLAKRHGKKVIAFAGGVTEDAYKCNQKGIDAFFSILRLPMTLDAAMDQQTTRDNLMATAEQVFRLIQKMG